MENDDAELDIQESYLVAAREGTRESGSLNLGQHWHGRSAIAEQVAGPQGRGFLW